MGDGGGNLEELIRSVEDQITRVEQKIDRVEDEIDGCRDDEERKLLRHEKAQLRDEKGQLRDKEAQLRAEKAQLREQIPARDLVVQNKKGRSADFIKRATDSAEEVKKRSREYIEKHGESKRPRLFQEPLWHCVPNLSVTTTRGFDRRFMKVSSTGGSTGVMVMGRSALGPLRQRVCDLIKGEIPGDFGYPMNTEIMLVHGPMGSGKSHIVVLLILDLTEEFASRPLSRRVRIIPIVDCQIALDGSVTRLLYPFIWAFADDEKSVRELQAISDFGQLETFLRDIEDTLVFVLDQWQVLEDHPDAKRRLQSIIISADYSFQVRVTSAGGEELKHEVSTSHPQAYLYPMSGGLNEDEMASFNLCYGTGCETKAVQALVDEQLGRNPFMLSSWHGHWLLWTGMSDQNFLNQLKEKFEGGAACIVSVGQGTALPSEPKAIDEDLPEEEGMNVLRMGGGDDVTKEKEAAAEDVTEAEVRDWGAWGSFINSWVVNEIRTSFRKMLDKLDSDIKLQQAMKEVLWNIVFRNGGIISHNHNILGNINLRYFVYDRIKGHVSCAFPLVRTELARFLGEEKKCVDFYGNRAWATLESAVRNGDPPSVVGLFAERCCNAAIAYGGGLGAILGPGVRSPTLKYFQTGTEENVAKEAVTDFMKSGMDEVCFIFLPQSPFYEAVDNIVVRLYREKKASNKNGGQEREARKKKATARDREARKKKAAAHEREEKAAERDVCMVLAKTQVTLQSMEKHSVSTILAMAPRAILPWIGEVNGKVEVIMAYVVPKETIRSPEKIEVSGCSPKVEDGERGAQRRQVTHTLLQIPFGKVHDKLKILDEWSSRKPLA